MEQRNLPCFPYSAIFHSSDNLLLFVAFTTLLQYYYSSLPSLTLIPATGGEITPLSAVSAENRTVSNEMRQLFFCDIVTDPLGYPMQLRLSLYVLPVLHGRFGSNVTGFATTSLVRLWSKDINFTDVTFLNVLKMERWIGRSVKNGILYIFKMTDKSNRARSHSHRLIQSNKSEVSITVILARKTVFDHAKLKESVHK